MLQRDELDKSGIYILTGTDPLSGSPRAYIGEAEVIRDRLKQHKTKEFWISAIVFVSKDENLTKAHVRYLESRLLTEATQAGRFTLEQNRRRVDRSFLSPIEPIWKRSFHASNSFSPYSVPIS